MRDRQVNAQSTHPAEDRGHCSTQLELILHRHTGAAARTANTVVDDVVAGWEYQLQTLFFTKCEAADLCRGRIVARRVHEGPALVGDVKVHNVCTGTTHTNTRRASQTVKSTLPW